MFHPRIVSREREQAEEAKMGATSGLAGGRRHKDQRNLGEAPLSCRQPL